MKLQLEPSPSHPHRSKEELIQFLRKEKKNGFRGFVGIIGVIGHGE